MKITENETRTSDNSRKSQKRSAVVKLAGDSGDGIQLMGSFFTFEAASNKRNFLTFPNFPAEMRAPAGAVNSVSSFQIRIGDGFVSTIGDLVDVLVALNPAALKVNVNSLSKGATIIINSDTFNERGLSKAEWDKDPTQDPGFLDTFNIVRISFSKISKEACKQLDVSVKDMERSKTFLALGILYKAFGFAGNNTKARIETKFLNNSSARCANLAALQKGLELNAVKPFSTISTFETQKGRFKVINGNQGVVYGMLAASHKSARPLFLGAYPITPANEILQQLSEHQESGVIVFQAEDEIAAICSAIGASYAGSLAFTSTSGPGMALKTEALGLAVIAELPLVIINVQRSGPSTGLPTKTEQADLFNAVFGRPGEAPLCVIAASRPSNCFSLTYKAAAIALKYMTPVILLSDGFISKASEPWRIPDSQELSEIKTNLVEPEGIWFEHFLPYKRDKSTLARPWAIPGTEHREHRLTGLEKLSETGSVCYEPENHHEMSLLRKKKIDLIASDIPPIDIFGENCGDLLVIGWGSTEGTIREAVIECRQRGLKVSSCHLYHLNPLPPDLEGIIKRFKKILIPEQNLGQLCTIIRSKFLVDAKGLNRVTGEPFKIWEIVEGIVDLCSQ